MTDTAPTPTLPHVPQGREQEQLPPLSPDGGGLGWGRPGPQNQAPATLLPFPAEAAYAHLRTADRQAGGLPIAERRRLLHLLARTLVDRSDCFVHALDADFGGRAAEETLLAEILSIAGAARYARKHLAAWAKPRRVPVDMSFWPTRARIVPQPLGVVGIVAPWNYPVHLALSPLIGAVAAGNRVALKPSELTPRTAAELARLLDDTFGPDLVRTVTGGPEVAAAFVRQPWDHLLFTGSTARGREVMCAAADNLTPLTLELGGKCPAIVLPDADLALAARAVIAGKALNAGQTCIAPDTVLLAGLPPETFVAALRQAARALFPNGPLTAVMSDTQAARLDRLTTGLELQPLSPQSGGRHRALSLALNPPPDALLLTEEIFGPILPLLSQPDLTGALDWINALPPPLAVYLFTNDRRAEAEVLAKTRAGALVVNGTVLQAAIEALPFGGVGASGFGRYHGRAGFDTFSNRRVHVRAARFSLARLVEPPYTDGKRRLIRRLLRLAVAR